MRPSFRRSFALVDLGVRGWTVRERGDAIMSHGEGKGASGEGQGGWEVSDIRHPEWIPPHHTWGRSLWKKQKTSTDLNDALSAPTYGEGERRIEGSTKAQLFIMPGSGISIHLSPPLGVGAEGE